MPLMFLWQLRLSVVGKVFKNHSKIYLASTKFENQGVKIGCLNYTFTFCKSFCKFILLKKVIQIKALGSKQNQQIIEIVSCYFVSLSRFLPKTAKISRYSQCLHSLCTKLWDTIFHLFEKLILENKIAMS